MTVTTWPSNWGTPLPNTLRMWCLLFIVSDASAEDARAQLLGKVRASKEVIAAAINVHLEDKILKDMRSEFLR